MLTSKPKYWLFKSEPDEFSIEDLRLSPKKEAIWDGVRNYQARNWLRDHIHPGDEILFYHSSCKVPGIAGRMVMVDGPFPDPSALDQGSPYYDEKSSEVLTRWYSIRVKHLETFKQIIQLTSLKQIPALEDFLLLKKGNRLSIMPVQENHRKTILDLKAEQA